MRIYGYFDDPLQTIPAFDPGLEVDCPSCGKPLEFPVKTISLMVPKQLRSYFYRTHKGCHDRLTEDQRIRLDGLLIGAITGHEN